MASTPFNIVLGRERTFHENVLNGTPANCGFVLVAITINEALDALKKHETLASLLTTNTEAAFANYVRKSPATVSPVNLDHNTNQLFMDADNVVWEAAGDGGPNEITTKLIWCYDPDTTTGIDADIIPMYQYDFNAETNGLNLSNSVDPSGYVVLGNN